VLSRAQLTCSILTYFLAAACVSAQMQSTVPANDKIIGQMAQAQAANRTVFRPYIVTRDYKLFQGEDHNQAKLPVVAEITVVPPDSKKYTIRNTSGSMLGEKIVRKMLDGEVAFAKDSGSTEITRDNYDFVFIREDGLNGQRCYVFQLVPKRKSKDLLRGTLWVDAGTYLPRRVEGEPAKSPSWWVTEVRVVLLYGYAGPMWLQTSSEATANVRILGPSTITWQDVRYQIGEVAPHSSAQAVASLGDITIRGQP
jgi:hypothetical protein